MNAPISNSHLGDFAKRPTRAKTIEQTFVWVFRVATYFVIVCASYIFLKIAYEGSRTVFQPTFPFVNIAFLTQTPQTLYVFQWEPSTFTEEQKEKVAAVEEEIRQQIPEREAFYKEAIPKAEQDVDQTRAQIKSAEEELKEIASRVGELTGERDRLERQLEPLKAKVEDVRQAQTSEAQPEATPADAEAAGTPTVSPEVAEALAAVKAKEEELAKVKAELDTVQNRESELTAERNAAIANLPGNLKKASQKEIENLKASLEWPTQEWLDKQKAEVDKINAWYEGQKEKITNRFQPKIDSATDLDEKARLQLRMDELNTQLDETRDQRLLKAKSIEVGDNAYRGVYMAKVEAAGLSVDSFSYSGGGIFPCIVGTVLLVIGSMFIALTLGVASAIFLSEYSRPGTLLNLIRLSILNLAGVPSIVFGLFGLGMFVLFLGWNVSLMAGWFTLAFMVLPVVITASEESLRSIPQGFREGSLALGASKWTSIRTNVLPYALPGILTSSVLGIARVAGETAPIMFTAAYALRDNLPWEGLNNWGDFFFQGVMALPYHIYVVSTKIPQNEFTERMQYGSAFVFLVIVALIALASVLLRIKVRKMYKW